MGQLKKKKKNEYGIWNRSTQVFYRLKTYDGDYSYI